DRHGLVPGPRLGSGECHTWSVPLICAPPAHARARSYCACDTPLLRGGDRGSPVAAGVPPLLAWEKQSTHLPLHEKATERGVSLASGSWVPHCLWVSTGSVQRHT